MLRVHQLLIHIRFYHTSKELHCQIVEMAVSIPTKSANGPSPDEITRRDLRDTKLWKDLSKHFQDLMSPGFGKVSGAVDPELSPDGKTVSFTGTIWTKMEGLPHKRVCVVDVATGKMEVITHGPNDDHQAKWSPNGRSLAFLSDRVDKGTFQLYVLNLDRLREANPVCLSKGATAEYASWSPTGDHILIGAAGQGADKAGGDGSGTLESGGDSKLPAWMPTVEPDAQKNLGRTTWVYDVAKEEICQVSRAGLNVWEAAWCGPKRIVAIVSDDPSESSWYDSTVDIIDADTGSNHTIYRSSVQVGIPAGSPSGSQAVFVEGLFSDRGVIAGNGILVDVASKSSTKLELGGVDASQLNFIGEDHLFFMGLRGFQAVSGRIDIQKNKASETWSSRDNLGYRYPEASQVVDGCFAVIRASWARYPEIGLVRDDKYQTLVSLDHGGGEKLRSLYGSDEEISWAAPDGTVIQGYLCLPKTGQKPYPLVLHVHGGPIWAFTNSWQMNYPWVPPLVLQGYAVLSANPRGSKGRGDDFANKVVGDMGGDDVGDFLSGIDSLVEKGIVDTKRVGVMGGSYGGFMSAWIITQTKRFAASCAMAPVTDWFSQHTTSNIPKFDHLMLQDDPYAPTGQYHDRSALRFVKNCSTPCLQLVGSEDRCTPASQALQFHNALIEHGVESVLVTYPGEGHGVRKHPALIDFCHRMISWFQRHLPA